MTWVWIALVGPVLYAISNHLDKLILSRFIKEDSADRWVLAVFSSLFGGIAIVPAVLLQPDAPTLAWSTALPLMLIGAMLLFAAFLYYTALKRDEASYVVPYYQTIPIFTYAAGALVLGELLTSIQMLGGTIIVAGAFILSLEGKIRDFHIRWPVVVPMLMASALLSLNDVLFKLLALDVGFWASVFWTYAGASGLSLVILVANSHVRNQFFSYVGRNNVRGMFAASVSESLYVIAEVAMHYATLLAPVVLVSLVNSLQPLLVLLLGIALTLFAPRVGSEDLSRSSLIQKSIAIVLLAIGTFVIGG